MHFNVHYSDILRVVYECTPVIMNSLKASFYILLGDSDYKYFLAAVQEIWIADTPFWKRDKYWHQIWEYTDEYLFILP